MGACCGLCASVGVSDVACVCMMEVWLQWLLSVCVRGHDGGVVAVVTVCLCLRAWVFVMDVCA